MKRVLRTSAESLKVWYFLLLVLQRFEKEKMLRKSGRISNKSQKLSILYNLFKSLDEKFIVKTVSIIQ